MDKACETLARSKKNISGFSHLAFEIEGENSSNVRLEPVDDVYYLQLGKQFHIILFIPNHIVIGDTRFPDVTSLCYCNKAPKTYMNLSEDMNLKAIILFIILTAILYTSPRLWYSYFPSRTVRIFNYADSFIILIDFSP